MNFDVKETAYPRNQNNIITITIYIQKTFSPNSSGSSGDVYSPNQAIHRF